MLDQLNLCNSFHITTEQQNNKQFMVVKMDSQTELVNFQIEMINLNKLEGFIPFWVQKKNGQVFLYYDITGTRTIKEYLDNIHSNGFNVISLLKSMIKPIIECDDYLLWSDSLLIDKEHTFVNSDNKPLYIYLPFKIDNDAKSSLKELLLRVLLHKKSIETLAKGEMLNSLLKYLNQSPLDYKKLLEIIEDIKIEESGGNKIETEYSNINPEININNLKKVVITPPQSIKIDEANLQIVKTSKPVKDKSKKEKTKISSLTVHIVLICLFLACLKFIRPYTKSMLETVGGLILVFGAADYFVVKKLVRKKSEEKNGSNNVDNKNIEIAQPKKLDTIKTGQVKLVTDNRKKDINLKVETDTENKDDLTQLLYNDETVLLNQTKKEAYFKDEKGNIVYEIGKKEVLIGRDKTVVDFQIDNKAVGKTHAVLICKDCKYFIRDLQSKNGTYVNQKIIPKGQEIELSENDLLTFANSTFIFVLGGCRNEI